MVMTQDAQIARSIVRVDSDGVVLFCVSAFSRESRGQRAYLHHASSWCAVFVCMKKKKGDKCVGLLWSGIIVAVIQVAAVAIFIDYDASHSLSNNSSGSPAVVAG